MSNTTPPREHDEVVRMLATCEETPAHTVPLVRLSAEGREIVIVSDLHISRGKTPTATFTGTENFFSDDSFERFLWYINTSLVSKGNRQALLVINGDFIDFLRVVAVPSGDAQYREWEQMLRRVGIEDKPAGYLKRSVSKKERDLGLKTDDYKSIWKLGAVAEGHATMFDALARWINQGHSLLIVKGNHDLEWYWPAVRNYLRLILADRLTDVKKGRSLDESLKIVLGHCSFVDEACVIDEEIYIEHGHRYDKFTNVVGSPTWGDKKSELNIPFGSFFNRYLVNKLELVYPFLDNARPSGNILHMLMRERFFLGVKVLFYYLPFAVKMIPKRYLKYMLKPVMGYLVAIGIPLAVVVILWWNRLGAFLGSTTPVSQQGAGLWGVILGFGEGFVRDVSLLFLSYLLSRFVSWAQLEEVAYLMKPAREKLERNPGYRLVTMGHTHNPEQYQKDGRWYINSSTWIPVIESSSSALREDKTYAVIYLERDAAGRLVIQPLQRWNDDAGRIEPLTIVERK